VCNEARRNMELFGSHLGKTCPQGSRVAGVSSQIPFNLVVIAIGT
jgi:uncharacterized protein (DUF169 family)